MKISRMAQSISPSPTLGLNEQAQALRAQGEPVIHLGIGEPKNPTPPAALEMLTERLNAGLGKYGPTAGSPGLKQAIIAYTEQHYSRTVSPGNVIVSTGAKQSLFNALITVVNPQEEVILLAPYWCTYPELVKLVQGVPVVVQPPLGSFTPRLEDIENALTPRTRALLVNSPNNPSGAVYPAEFLTGVAALCAQRGIWLLTDDIYHQLVFDGCTAHPIYKFTQQSVDESQIVVVNGISKTYGMTGYRIGWVVGPRKVVAAMNKIQGQTTSCASVVSQAAAEGALTGDQSGVEDLRQLIQSNRDLVMSGLREISGVKLVEPHGTFYCLPDFSAINPDSKALAGFILEKALVVTIPGVDFGAEGHLRISYAGSPADVKEGLARLMWLLSPDSPGEFRVGERVLTKE